MSPRTTPALTDTAADDVTATFDHLREQTEEAGQSSVAERRGYLSAVAQMIGDHHDDIADAMRDDLGRDPVDTFGELIMVKTEAEHARKHLPRWLAPERVRRSLLSLGSSARVIREPLGTALILSTWNAPFVISLTPLIGLLAGGNTGILKPSELAPASSRLLHELIPQYLPADRIAVVQGGPDTAKALLELPFDKIAYTGSAAVGTVVATAAAHHHASLTLEMGGKNPAIVDASAHLADTAAKLVWGRYMNCGQACVAPDYVLAHSSIIDELTDRISQAITDQFDPHGAGIQHGTYSRMINARHHTRVLDLLDDATARGAHIAHGGLSDPTDLYIEPTVLRAVTDDMRIMNEEIFGPLLPIVEWTDDDGLYAAIRRRSKPLALYIFAQNRARTQQHVRHTRAGSTVINHTAIQAGTNPNLPFGGVGPSGSGRLVGKATFHSFTNPRSIVTQHRGPLDTSKLAIGPHNTHYETMLRKQLQTHHPNEPIEP